MLPPFDLYNLPPEYLQDAADIERESAVYQAQEDGSYIRIELTPDEIRAYIESLKSYDQFRGLCLVYPDERAALSHLPNTSIRARVQRYGVEMPENDPFCLAAFLTDALEALLTGEVSGRRAVRVLPADVPPRLPA
jgi:hypothetical protein